MDFVVRMEAWTKQFHFCFASTTSHCLNGIEIRGLKYLPFYILHPCVFVFDVNNDGEVTINLSNP